MIISPKRYFKMNSPTDSVESQISTQQKEVDFDTREFTIEIIVSKYNTGIDKEDNELYVPDYQRDFVWDDERQSRLIESIILGLPIPVIFVAENSDGKLEIVDGSQRIRTLSAFLNNELTLIGLERLNKLNKLKFSDLEISRQRKIKNTPIRMIVLSESATDSVKNDLFERINRGSDTLRNMEKRKGIYRGDFNDFIYNECIQYGNNAMARLAPLSNAVKNRQEHEELILRFFAFSHDYPEYSKYRNGVSDALDRFMQNMNEGFDNEKKNKMLDDYKKMINFVDESFCFGFAKKKEQGVSRIFFEALSVGVHLALRENAALKLPEKINPSTWLRDESFMRAISGSYRTHAASTIKLRVEFVKEQLLKSSVVGK